MPAFVPTWQQHDLQESFTTLIHYVFKALNTAYQFSLTKEDYIKDVHKHTLKIVMGYKHVCNSKEAYVVWCLLINKTNAFS